MAEDGFESRVSEDGKIATLTITRSGRSVTFDLPSEQLPHLMMFASQTASKAMSRQSGRPRAFHMIPVDAWRCIPAPDPEHVLLQYQLAGSLETTLRLHRNQLPEMIAALQRLQGQPPTSQTAN